MHAYLSIDPYPPFPHIDLAAQKVSVFGHAVKPSAALRPADRAAAGRVGGDED